MSITREDEGRLTRLHLAAHDPALLLLLDRCRELFAARLTVYWCPLISVHYVDYLGRPTHAYWRGARFERYTRGCAPRARSRYVAPPPAAASVGLFF